MRHYYTYISLSNGDEDGYPLLPEQHDTVLLCTWSENIANRFLNELTYTECIKPLRDVVTGEIIYPAPVGTKLARRLTYIKRDHIIKISAHDAKEFLRELRRNPEKLAKYIQHIEDVKRAIKIAKKEKKMTK